jgi:hypothetical protein
VLSPNDAGIGNLESELSARGRAFKGKQIFKFKAMTHSVGIIRKVEPLLRSSIAITQLPQPSGVSNNLPPSTIHLSTPQPPFLHGSRVQSDFDNLLIGFSPTTKYVDAWKKHNCKLTFR